jgi:uncharacterized membrane protein YtjA (UPF0391 family)
MADVSAIRLSGLPDGKATSWEVAMFLRWALGFFVIALIAAVLGFGGIAVAAAGIAKIIFFLFLVLFVVALVGHFFRQV